MAEQRGEHCDCRTRSATSADGSVDDCFEETPAEFFRDRGFELLFTRHNEEELIAIYADATEGLSRKTRRDLDRALAEGRIGPVFADLHAPNGHIIRGYGTGANESSAASRAVQRWKTEQGV